MLQEMVQFYSTNLSQAVNLPLQRGRWAKLAGIGCGNLMKMKEHAVILQAPTNLPTSPCGCTPQHSLVLSEELVFMAPVSHAKDTLSSP